MKKVQELALLKRILIYRYGVLGVLYQMLND